MLSFENALELVLREYDCPRMWEGREMKFAKTLVLTWEYKQR